MSMIGKILGSFECTPCRAKGAWERFIGRKTSCWDVETNRACNREGFYE